MSSYIPVVAGAEVGSIVQLAVLGMIAGYGGGIGLCLLVEHLIT